MPEEGFTCANPFTVNWVYDSVHGGQLWWSGRLGPPPGGSTSDEYGDCECLCGNGNAFNPQVSRTKQALTPEVSLKVSARVRVQ